MNVKIDIVHILNIISEQTDYDHYIVELYPFYTKKDEFRWILEKKKTKKNIYINSDNYTEHIFRNSIIQNNDKNETIYFREVKKLIPFENILCIIKFIKIINNYSIPVINNYHCEKKINYKFAKYNDFTIYEVDEITLGSDKKKTYTMVRLNPNIINLSVLEDIKLIIKHIFIE